MNEWQWKNYQWKSMNNILWESMEQFFIKIYWAIIYASEGNNY